LLDFEAERENIIRGRTERSSLNGGHATTTRSPASTRYGGSLPEKRKGDMEDKQWERWRDRGQGMRGIERCKTQE